MIKQIIENEIKKVLTGESEPQCERHPYSVMSNYVIRTVTMTLAGRLSAVFEKELVLTDAAWIADTGRFSNFVAGKIEANEIEPFPDGQVIVGRGSIVDAVKVSFEPPRKQK